MHADRHLTQDLAHRLLVSMRNINVSQTESVKSVSVCICASSSLIRILTAAGPNRHIGSPARKLLYNNTQIQTRFGRYGTWPTNHVAVWTALGRGETED